MTAPHPVASSFHGLPAREEIAAWLLDQDELDVRAVATRAACDAARLHPALTAALVARAASPAVVRSAAARFSNEAPWGWPSVERALAGKIVAACIDAERAGLLERPCVEPLAGGAS